MATVFRICLFCYAEENIMLKNKRTVVLMVVIGVLNLPVCAGSYEYVTLSPNSNVLIIFRKISEILQATELWKVLLKKGLLLLSRNRIRKWFHLKNI